MLEWLGPAGIVIGIIILIIAAYKGVNIIVIAPLAAAIVVLSNGLNVKDSLLGLENSYMSGLGRFVINYFIIFALGSVLGKYLEDSRATFTIAEWILQLTGKSNAYTVLVAIAIIGAILSYGGISVFIVVFTLAPLARPLFRELNIAWHLFIAALFAGVGTFTMTMLPGTPAIQNVIPTQLGTTLTAAPLMSIICTIVVIVYSLIYIKRQLSISMSAGEGYVAGDKKPDFEGNSEQLSPPLGLSLAPMALLIAIILVGSAMRIPDVIVPALLVAIASAAVLLHNYLPSQLNTINTGAINAIAPTFFTAAAVGVGSVVTLAPGFKLILDLISALPGGTLMQVTAVTGLLSVVTASPSGALGIVIPAFGETWIASGVAPEVIHRVAAIASGAFGAMPHCGVVFAVMAVTGLSHKSVFRHFFAIGFGGGMAALVTALLLAGLY